MLYRRILLILVCILCSVANSDMYINNPFWYGIFDVGGYSDAIYWGNSPYHPYSYHELLSGEWAAAIYYDGIATEPNAMWLTHNFIAPWWITYSNFDTVVLPNSWYDSNNPVNGYDTGYSVIDNNDVEIRIDYEVAQLSGAGYSPLSY